MNVKNNKRRRTSQERIEKAFVELLQTCELNKITVSEIIKRTGLNRSTFYANYMDIFDLADKTREKLEKEFGANFIGYDYFNEQDGAKRVFAYIKENRIFYNTYFKLCYDEKHLISIYDEERAKRENLNSNVKYHIEFFRNGFNAIVRLWLSDGCKESPEEMAEVLKQEYRWRDKLQN